MKKVAIYQVLSYHSSKISGMTGLLQAYLLGHDPVNSLYTAPIGWAMRKNDLFQGCGSSSFFVGTKNTIPKDRKMCKKKMCRIKQHIQ